MTNKKQIRGRITALLLAVSLLFSVASIPVFAEASPEEPGVSQEAQAPANPEQTIEDNTETEDDPAEKGGDDQNAGEPDAPEDTEPGPTNEPDESGPANRAPAATPTTLGYSSILAFEPLDAEVAHQEVVTGTALADLNLPDALAATVEGEEVAQAQNHVPVARWNAEPDYDPLEIGAYRFTPELVGWTLEDSAALPEITVQVVMGVMATAAGDVEINAANYPDAAFLQWVKDNCDKNGDEVLSAEEIAAVDRIMIVNNNTIFDLTGIEHFTALDTLICFSLSLSALDISGNPMLENLNYSSNSISTLDLSNNPNLKFLDCQNNSLTTLDLSGCPSLNSISIHNNPYESLTLPGGEKLQIDVSPANSGTVMMTGFTLSSESVTLTATGISSSDFVEWTGTPTAPDTNNVVTFPLYGNMTVTAKFSSQYHLGDVEVINNIMRRNWLTGYNENNPATGILPHGSTPQITSVS